MDLSNFAAHPATAASRQHLSFSFGRDRAGDRKQSRHSIRALHPAGRRYGSAASQRRRPAARADLQRVRSAGGRGRSSQPTGDRGGHASHAAGSVPTNPSELGALSLSRIIFPCSRTTPLVHWSGDSAVRSALIGQLNWTHQTTPDTNPFAAGVNALAGSTTNANAGYTQGFGPGTELNVGFDNSTATPTPC